MILQTATQLFARYRPSGDETCFYCGGPCDRSHAASDVVKSSFTGLDTVTLSEWVCTGCVEAMQEKINITQIDGDSRDGQKVRGYSWIITETERKACTKSHRAQLLDACVSPPPVPFAICISDSGQKHLLYRSVVNHNRDLVTVTLEGEPVTYRPSELLERIELCKRVCAATGKPAMKDAMSVQTQMRIVEHFDSDDVLAAWQDCFSQPLTRLAVWLCPPKEMCLNDYPAPITATTTGEPKHKHSRGSATPSLFD
jgi:CRISPR type IV-associated protein Csf1